MNHKLQRPSHHVLKLKTGAFFGRKSISQQSERKWQFEKSGDNGGRHLMEDGEKFVQTPMNKLLSFFHCKVSSGARLLWGKPPPTHIGKCILARKHTQRRTCMQLQSHTAVNCSFPPPTHASLQMSSYTRRCISQWHAGAIGTPRARHVDNVRQDAFLLQFRPPSLLLGRLYFKKHKHFAGRLTTSARGKRALAAGGSRVKRGSW